MISYIRGQVVRVSPTDATIEVFGVGYRVFIGAKTFSELQLQNDVLLHTAQIFREDSVSLYGFTDIEELELFNLLGTVNGVGPKSALAIVNQLGIDGITSAVATADDSVFKSVSGVGPKTAKLIILSLTGKLSISTSTLQSTSNSVLQALQNLGYLERVARVALDSALQQLPEASESELLKLALSELAATKGSR
ncbi:MAG: Holliday junction branch migration protein RuvA [Micrococcales bacterium]|nr:Holliday junction branch migration protein RuvA [Micrococcales bacterium]